MLHQPCTENAVQRDGHQNHRRTIGDALNHRATTDVNSAFTKHELNMLRLSGRRTVRR